MNKLIINKLVITRFIQYGVFAGLSVLSSWVVAQEITQTDAQPTMVKLDLTAAQQQAFGLLWTEVREQKTIPSASWSAQVATTNGQSRLLSAPASGELQLENMSEGMRIVPGQLLARVMSSESLDLQRQLLSSQSALSLAQADLKRATELVDSGVVAQKRLQEAREQVDNLNQTLAQYSQTLLLMGMEPKALETLKQTKQLQSAALNLRAQQPGLVVKLLARSGERVSTNQPILEWLQLSGLTLHVSVSIEQANQLSLGQKVRLVDYPAQGEVVMVDGRVDRFSQSVRVVVALAEQVGRLRPGQSVQVQFLQLEDSAFEVPNSALIDYNDQTWLFVKTEQVVRALVVKPVFRSAQTAMFVSDEPLAQSQVVSKGTAALKGWLAQMLEGEE